MSLSDYQFAHSSRVIDVPCDSICLYSHSAALRAWQKFLGFVPDKECANASSSKKKTDSTFTLVRFDAFIATAVSCFQDDGTDTGGGQRQSLTTTNLSAFSCWPTTSFLEALEPSIKIGSLQI